MRNLGGGGGGSKAEAREMVERLAAEHLVEYREQVRATTLGMPNGGMQAGEAVVLLDPVRDYLGCRGKSELPQWHAGLMERSRLTRTGPDIVYWGVHKVFKHHLIGAGTSLLQPGRLSSFRALLFSHGELGDEGANALTAAMRSGALPNLELVHINDRRCNPEAGPLAMAIACCDKESPPIKSLELGISGEGLKAFSLACANEGALPYLKELGLDEMVHMSEEGIRAFSSALSRGVLPSLSTLVHHLFCHGRLLHEDHEDWNEDAVLALRVVCSKRGIVYIY